MDEVLPKTTGTFVNSEGVNYDVILDDDHSRFNNQQLRASLMAFKNSKEEKRFHDAQDDTDQLIDVNLLNETENPNESIQEQKDHRVIKNKRELLYEFCIKLLRDQNTYPSVLSWVNPKEFVFKIENPAMMAQLWGETKKNKEMTYDKLARGIRDSRKRKYFDKVNKKQYGSHYILKFGKKSIQNSPYLQTLNT